MSIKELIRKIFKEKQEEIEIQDINLEQLPDKLEEELKIIKSREDAAKKEIISLKEIFNSELKELIEKSRNIDLDKRRENERLKFIAKENLKIYLDSAEKLSEGINQIEYVSLEGYITDFNKILINFVNISKSSFEKATLLTDIGNIKEKINEFFSKIQEIYNENKINFEKLKTISQIKGSISEIESINLSSIKENIKKLEEKPRELNNKREEIEKQIKDLINSQEYKREQDNKERIKIEKEKLDREIYNLKEKMDLRYLSKYFHSDEKKSRLTKKYSENFKQALEEDKNLEIISLVKEAKNLELEEIKIMKDKIQKKEIHESAVDEKMTFLEEEKRKLDSELIRAREDLVRENKKNEKLSEKKLEIKRYIGDKASLFNLKLNF